MFLESNILIITIKNFAFSERLRMRVRQVVVSLHAILEWRFIFHSWNYPPSTLFAAFWRHFFILCEIMHLRKGICLSKNKATKPDQIFCQTTQQSNDSQSIHWNQNCLGDLFEVHVPISQPIPLTWISGVGCRLWDRIFLTP